VRPGTTVTEVALIVPIVLLLLLGIAECAQIIYAYGAVSEAARIGGRYAIVHGSQSTSPVGPTANDAALRSIVLANAPGLNSAQLSVTSSWPNGGNDAACPVTVTVTYSYALTIGQLIGYNSSLSISQ
jgi:Flp pilus assembly protein TadG